MGVADFKNLTYLSDTFVGERKLYEDVDITDKPLVGVLRVIEGPLAEWDTLNRNGRKYSERLWDNVLESPYVKEQLSYHTLYGESNHPQDRFEIDFARVSHSIVDMWKNPSTNQIYGRIYILDTPMGRILNTLYEAGGILGYSSRAGGVLNQQKGFVEVDEKTYNFITFDAVPYPSVISARPGVVTEGTEQLEQLSEETHNSLCQIIKESYSLGNKEILKDFIYSITGYDLSREKELFESNVKSNGNTNNPISESTMTLIKESSLQINNLKAEVSTLKTTNNALTLENENLKLKIDSSLNSIAELNSKSKVLEGKVQDNETTTNDTIVSLESKVESLTSLLEERELELEELKGVHEAFKVLKLENEGIKSSLSNIDESVSSSESANIQLTKDLNEAYNEITVLVKESAEKDEKITQLSNNLSKLKTQVSKQTKIDESSNTKIENLNKSLSSLRKDNKSLSNEIESIKESYQSHLTELQEENTKLSDELQQTKGKLESIVNEQSNTIDYSSDLVEVISGTYGLDSSIVEGKLTKGFTKSEVYAVCESLSNSIKSHGIDISNAFETESVKINENTSINPDVSRISNIFSGMGNRRGI